MSIFDDVMQFIAKHPLAILLSVGVVVLLVFFYSITDMGKAEWKLMMDHSILFLRNAAVLLSPVMVYLYMIRPISSEQKRASPEEVWIAARKRYPGYLRNGSMPRQIRRDKIDSVFFTGQIFDNFRTTLRFCDVRDNRLGMILDVFQEQNDDTKIDQRLKRGLTAEEKLQQIAEGKRWLADVQGEHKRAEEGEEIFGNGGGKA